jgi:hypothetical protein
VCGAANGTTVTAAPTTRLCSAGSPTTVTTDGSAFIWQCQGTNGGNTDGCLAFMGSSSSSGGACSSSGGSGPADGQYPVGLYVWNPGGSADWTAALNDFTNAMGKPPTLSDVFTSFASWADFDGDGGFEPTGFRAATQANASFANGVPIVGVPLMINDWTNQASIFQEIINGQHDSDYAGIVDAWAGQGFPGIYVRIGYEHNGTFMPWYAGYASSIDQWVSAFRHVAQLMKSEGQAKGINVMVVWNPVEINYNDWDTRTTYPGDDVVDVIGTDVYSPVYPTDLTNWDANGNSLGTTAPDAATWASSDSNRIHFWNYPGGKSFDPTNSGGWSLLESCQFAGEHGKPIAIPETGSGNQSDATGPHDDGVFPQWLRQTLDTKCLALVAFVDIWDISPGDGQWCFTCDGTKPLTKAAWSSNFGLNSPPAPNAATCPVSGSSSGVTGGSSSSGTTAGSSSSGLSSGTGTGGSSSGSSSGATASSGSSSGGITRTDGTCGPVSGTTVGSAPATGLCSAGTPTMVMADGVSWIWQCQGTNGGNTDGCFAFSSSTSSSSSSGGSTSSSSGSSGSGACSSLGLPSFDHLVVVMEENHGYGEIIGSSQAPYINSLASQGALFTQSFAISHPSLPNYLAIYAGSTFGVADDNQRSEPDPTLYTELQAANLGFAGYVETPQSNGDYDHNPWESFPEGFSVEQDFSQFPADFSQLPPVSFVIPNVDDDMHNGTILQGDQWLQAHIDAYATWAASHNSLLIVTWDEDDGGNSNQVATIFSGAHVKPGQYSEQVDHYRVLRTVEDLFGVPALNNSAATTRITDIWDCGAAGGASSSSGISSGSGSGSGSTSSSGVSTGSSGGSSSGTASSSGTTSSSGSSSSGTASSSGTSSSGQCSTFAAPATTLHYAAGSNSSGSFAPAAADGFNLADVGSVDELNALPTGDMGLVWIGLCNGADASFVSAVSPFIGNPELYGFYLMDEPDPTGQFAPLCPAANLKAESDWIHANVPGAKTFIVMMNMGADTNPSYANSYNPANSDLDLFGLDPYPCKQEFNGCDDSVIPASVMAAEAEGIPASSIVPVYQAFGGGGYSAWTVPTSADERQLLAAWQSVIPLAPFDYAYAWGVQNGDQALSVLPDLQLIFLQKNTSDNSTGSCAR